MAEANQYEKARMTRAIRATNEQILQAKQLVAEHFNGVSNPNGVITLGILQALASNYSALEISQSIDAK
jgi:hypothetical protein